MKGAEPLKDIADTLILTFAVEDSKLTDPEALRTAINLALSTAYQRGVNHGKASMSVIEREPQPM